MVSHTARRRAGAPLAVKPAASQRRRLDSQRFFQSPSRFALPPSSKNVRSPQRARAAGAPLFKSGRSGTAQVSKLQTAELLNIPTFEISKVSNFQNRQITENRSSLRFCFLAVGAVAIAAVPWPRSGHTSRARPPRWTARAFRCDPFQTCAAGRFRSWSAHPPPRRSRCR